MSASPSVSVLVPAYQAERTIGGTLTGVLTQDYPGPVQVIVVDDGSTDATADIARAHGDRVTVLTQANGGTAAARNTALAHADGDLVALCDADDILLPPYLRAAVDAWQHAGAGRRFVTTDALLLTDGGIAHGRTVMGQDVPASERQRLAILEWNFVSGFALMPMALLKESHGWRTDSYLEDWDLWIRAIHAGWEVVAQRTPHALYRWVPTSKSTGADEVFAAEDALLRRILDDSSHLPSDERDYLQRRLATRSPRLLVFEAEQALRIGDMALARRRYDAAAALLPSNRRLALKRRSLRVPGAAALWRRRLIDIDARLARDTDAPR